MARQTKKRMVEVRTVAGGDVDQNLIQFSVVAAQEEVATLRDVSRDQVGIAKAIKGLRELGVTRLVLESTGGLELPVAKAFHKAGIEVCIVNPSYVRSFANGLGRRAKTDHIDAFVLARYAENKDLRAWSPPTLAKEQLVSLVRTRASVVAQKVAMCNRRRKLEHELSTDVIDQLVTSFKTAIKTLDKRIESHIEAHDEFRARYRRYRSVPGIGPVVAAVLVVELPELATASKKQLASLAGVAPYSNDSGQTKGKRAPRGGRHRVRQPLYMAAQAAIKHDPGFKAKAASMLARGKSPKVVLVAIMRNLIHVLSSMEKHQTNWQPERRIPLSQSQAAAC